MFSHMVCSDCVIRCARAILHTTLSRVKTLLYTMFFYFHDIYKCELTPVSRPPRITCQYERHWKQEVDYDHGISGWP